MPENVDDQLRNRPAPASASSKSLVAFRGNLAAAAENAEFSHKSLRELDAELTEALEYRNWLRDSECRDRYSAQRALMAVVRLLEAHDGWRPLALPLTQLLGAVRDLENGYVAPMLRPVVTASGRPVSWYETTLKGYAAGIMGGLMKHARMQKAEAAGWLSKTLGGAGHDVAVNTIIDWRKNALDHKKYPDLYRAYCTVIDLTEWSAPLPCAEKLVAQLIKLHAQKGG